MSECFIGEIRAFPYSFTPLDWLPCDGRIVSVAQYQALYSLIGNTYGGTQNQTFGLPDLRGRAVIGQGQGPGLTNYVYGSHQGAETVTLNGNQTPNHSHTLSTAFNGLAAAAIPDYTPAPIANVSWPSRYYNVATPATPLALEPYNPKTPNPDTTPTVPTTPVLMASQALSQSAGNGQAHENRQPFLPIAFAICAIGWYPTPP